MFELETQSQNLYAFFFLNSKRLFCVQTSKIRFKGLDSLHSVFWRHSSICIQYGPGLPNAITAFLAQQIKDVFLRTGKKLWEGSPSRSPERKRGSLEATHKGNNEYEKISISDCDLLIYLLMACKTSKCLLKSQTVLNRWEPQISTQENNEFMGLEKWLIG